MTGTNTIKHHRVGPALILAAFGLAGTILLRTADSASVVAAAADADPAALKAQLEQRIGHGRADAALWRQYGDCLSRLKDPSGAAAAYAKVLEQDPMNRDVRFLHAVALASAGHADPFYGAVSDLILDDPRLTCEVLDRPESHAYLTSARFRRLRDEARAQAID